MRESIFDKKNKCLFLFNSKNTAKWVNCPNVKIAKEKIKKTNIEQVLKIV